ncbi:hypothetical protein Tco_1256145 [Tanacetum coccineum]
MGICAELRADYESVIRIDVFACVLFKFCGHGNVVGIVAELSRCTVVKPRCMAVVVLQVLLWSRAGVQRIYPEVWLLSNLLMHAVFLKLNTYIIGAFGKNFEEKHVTCARFEKKLDKNTNFQACDFHSDAFTKSAQKVKFLIKSVASQIVETVSEFYLDAIDLNKEIIEQENELESDGDDDLPEVADLNNVAKEIKGKNCI